MTFRDSMIVDRIRTMKWDFVQASIWRDRSQNARRDLPLYWRNNYNEQNVKASPQLLFKNVCLTRPTSLTSDRKRHKRRMSLKADTRSYRDQRMSHASGRRFLHCMMATPSTLVKLSSRKMSSFITIFLIEFTIMLAACAKLGLKYYVSQPEIVLCQHRCLSKSQKKGRNTGMSVLC